MKVLSHSFAAFVCPFVIDKRLGLPPLSIPTQTPDSSPWIHSDWAVPSTPHPPSAHEGNRVSLVFEDLVPHIARYISPNGQTATIYEVNPALLDKLGSTGWCLHKGTWMFSAKGHPPQEIKFGSIKLAIFCTGIASLILEARPVTDNSSQWLDFLRNFRMWDRGRGHILTGHRHVLNPSGETCDEVICPSIVPSNQRQEKGGFLISDLVQAIINTVPGANVKQSKASSHLFIPGQAIVYQGTFIEEIDQDQIENWRIRFVRLLRAGQPFTPGAAEGILGTASLAYAEHQWFHAQHGSIGFFAGNPPHSDFYSSTLPGHLMRVYFVAALLTLHQKFALLNISNSVAAQWRGQQNSSQLNEIFHQVNRSLLQFTAQCYFVQAMQSDNHQRYYVWLQTYLGVPALYDEVRNEVTEMQNALVGDGQRAQRQRDLALQRILAFSVAVGLVLSWADVHNIQFLPEAWPSWLRMLPAMVLSLSFLLVFSWRARSRMDD